MAEDILHFLSATPAEGGGAHSFRRVRFTISIGDSDATIQKAEVAILQDPEDINKCCWVETDLGEVSGHLPLNNSVYLSPREVAEILSRISGEPADKIEDMLALAVFHSRRLPLTEFLSKHLPHLQDLPVSDVLLFVGRNYSDRTDQPE